MTDYAALQASNTPYTSGLKGSEEFCPHDYSAVIPDDAAASSDSCCCSATSCSPSSAPTMHYRVVPSKSAQPEVTLVPTAKEHFVGTTTSSPSQSLASVDREYVGTSSSSASAKPPAVALVPADKTYFSTYGNTSSYSSCSSAPRASYCAPVSSTNHVSTSRITPYLRS